MDTKIEYLEESKWWLSLKGYMSVQFILAKSHPTTQVFQPRVYFLVGGSES
jgi:hypothetical protein